MRKFETDIMNAAFEWQAAMADDQVSASTKRDFHLWLEADPLHRQAFQEAESFGKSLENLQKEDLDEAFFKASWQERLRALLVNSARAVYHCLTYKPRTVAASAVGLAAVILLCIYLQPLSSEPNSQKKQLYTAGVGKITTIALDDGTRITLGAATSIDVSFTQISRQINMSEGTAFFEVAKDEARPFTVTSGGLTVTVRGTAFDIRKTKNSAHVAVAEGVVSVAYASPESAASPTEQLHKSSAQTASHKEKILTAGEQISIEKNRPAHAVSILPQEHIGAWRSNILVYIDAPLSEIIADINRYRHTQLVIPEAETANLRLTVTFNADNIDGMLKSLPEALPVVLEPSVSNSTAILRRPQ